MQQAGMSTPHIELTCLVVKVRPIEVTAELRIDLQGRRSSSANAGAARNERCLELLAPLDIDNPGVAGSIQGEGKLICSAQ